MLDTVAVVLRTLVFASGLICRCRAAHAKLVVLQADEQSWKGLYARLLSARRYARVNALALRKISKKHDKVLGSKAGHQFLQVTRGPPRCTAAVHACKGTAPITHAHHAEASWVQSHLQARLTLTMSDF